MRPHELKAALQKVYLQSESSTFPSPPLTISNTTMASEMEVDSKGPSKIPVVVTKPTPYTFDLGLLLASDPNPLLLSDSSNLEQDLAATARDGAQALLNQLLSTCPISSTPNGVLLSLPGIETNLPREKVYSPLSFPPQFPAPITPQPNPPTPPKS